MKSYLITEIKRLMMYYLNQSDAYKLTPPDSKAVSEGLQMSKTVCAQQEVVVTTPWMKNLLIIFGDVKQTYNTKTNSWETEKLTIQKAGKTKAGNFLASVVSACLLKYNGKVRTEYNENVSVLDKDNYDVDCYLQNKFNDYWFDIAPGQAKERSEALKQYEVSTRSGIKVLMKYLDDPVFAKAVEFVTGRYPDIKADPVVKKISSPFMAKDSNVGYPHFRNDKLPVSENSQETYGGYTIRRVEEITHNMNPKYVFNILKFNVYTVWARNQRGKGRALEAQSRYVNLVCNSLEANEVEALKKLPEYIGLKSDEDQKAAMIKMAEFLEANQDYVAGNWDQSGFDRHINQFLVLLSAAIRAVHCNGTLAQRLNLLRYLQTQKGYCIDGSNNKLTVIYGRTMSGDIDTMTQNTNINNLIDVYSNMSSDKDYSDNVLYKTDYHGFYLGDDVLSIHKKGIPKQDYASTCSKFGLEVNTSKYAYGLFFLQYRLFKDEDGYHMVYPWPRVLRSMLSKENKKGLGPVGWAVAGWQQLAKLIDYKPALSIVASLMIPLDFDHFFIDKPIEWVKDQITKEDQAAKVKKGRKSKTTAEILYQGNPQQDNQFKTDSEKVELEFDYLASVQKAIKDSYIPNFYEKLGFKTPDLSKIKH